MVRLASLVPIVRYAQRVTPLLSRVHYALQARFTELFGAKASSSVKPSATQDANPVTKPGASVLGGERHGFTGVELTKSEAPAAKKARKGK